MLIGLYRPGDSALHRLRPGVKLAGLSLGLLVLGLATGPLGVGAAATGVGVAVVVTLAAVARLPARLLAAQLRPALWVCGLIAVLQWWWAGPVAAAVAAGSLLVAVALAALVTLTTRTQDLLDALVTALRPLRRLGVDPDRVALLLALTVRSVPVVAELAGQVQEARRARGADRSVRAFAVPLVIRTVRYADRLGEALAARGVDD